MPLTVAASAEDADAKKVQAVFNTLQTSTLIAEDVWGLQEDNYLRPQCVLYIYIWIMRPHGIVLRNSHLQSGHSKFMRSKIFQSPGFRLESYQAKSEMDP